MRFQELLDVLENNTYMSIKWNVSKTYSYQGYSQDYYESTDDVIVISVGFDDTDGLIITIGVSDE